MNDAVVDKKYYQAAPPNSFADRLIIMARARIYQDFLQLCRPGRQDTILDVGVSDVVGESPNLLERLYPHRDRITALGLGTAEQFQAEYPDIAYQQVIPNSPLPFPDQCFDVAASNAVLEHVGSVENQRRFIAEMMRVARQVYITVPHRFFPVEHHTGLPVLHYLDATFGPACRLLGKPDWGRREQLILMSRGRLRQAWPEHARVGIGFTGLRLGLFSSNLFAHWQRST